MVGIWIADLPAESLSDGLKNPLVWAACLRYSLLSPKFKQNYSPSTDKNTFLAIHFDRNT